MESKIVDTLNYSWELVDPVAYIITIKGHHMSEQLSARCQESCDRVKQEYIVWDAFDGTDKATIKYPQHAIGKEQFTWLKQMNDRLTVGEIACILSHFSLWCHCVTIDKPIVILEHDAIMAARYPHHPGWNQINYLGNKQQLEAGGYYEFPIHAAATKNHRFICRAHAYAIDPAVARQLISHVIRFGLSAPADMLIRVDLFNVVQTGFYAYDLPIGTTIADRDPSWERNANEIFTSFI